MTNTKKYIIGLFIIISLCIFSPKANAFFYPVGPVFDPLNIAGESITTVSTVASKVLNIKATVNEKINNFKKALAELIGGVLGGKRKPGKVPGAKIIDGSDYVDYADEAAVKQVIYDLFWTYPAPTSTDQAVSDQEAIAYKTKATEFYQDNVLEVWAAVRGLEAELENIKKDTQALTEEIRNDTGSGGDNLGLNELWKKTYEAYKTYDMLYSLIEEMTAMKAQVIMSKAIKYDVKPKYKEVVNTSSLSYTTTIGYASQSNCSSEDMFCDGSAGAGNVPFSGSKDDVEELAKFVPVRDKLVKAIEYHNTMFSLNEYKKIFKSLEDTQKLHEKSIEMLTKSDNCVLSFLGRYYENPNQIWFGSDERPQSQDHENRFGLSGWAYKGLYVAEKALETQTMEVEYTEPTSEAADAKTSDYNSAISGYSGNVDTENVTNASTAVDGAGGVKKPQLSSGSTGADQDPPALTTASKYGDSSDNLDSFVIETGDKVEIEGEYVNADETSANNKYDEDEQEKERKKVKKDMEDDDDIGFESSEDLQQQSDDVRRLNLTYWKTGTTAIKDLSNNADKWSAKVKKKYQVWLDQKLYYSDYVDQKYTNIEEYLENLDVSKLIDYITGILVEDKAQYASTKETEYNTTSLAIRSVSTNIANADMALAGSDKALSLYDAKNERDKKINIIADNLDDRLTAFNNQNKTLNNSFAAVEALKTRASILSREAQQDFNSINISLNTLLQNQKKQGVTDGVEVESFNLVTKNVLLEFYSTIASMDNYTNPASILSQGAALTGQNTIKGYQTEISKAKERLKEITSDIQRIFTEDYTNATAGGNPDDVTSIKSNQSTLDGYVEEISRLQDSIADYNNRIDDVAGDILESAILKTSIEEYQEKIIEISASLGDQASSIESVQDAKDKITSNTIEPMVENIVEVINAIAVLNANNTALGTTYDLSAITSLQTSLNSTLSELRAIERQIAVPELDEENSNASIISYIEATNESITDAQNNYNSSVATINNNYANSIISIKDTLDVAYETIAEGNKKAIDNINSYTENRQDGTGEFIAAEPLHDIIGRVEEQIKQSKDKIAGVVAKYKAIAAQVEREDYRPENHNVFVDIHKRMFDEITAIKIDVHSIATDNIVLLSLNVFEYLLRELKLNAGDEDEYKIIDNQYFVGSIGKYRDLRIPKYPESTEDFHPRELIYFDEVDWVNVGGKDGTVSREKFINAINYLPTVWRNMLTPYSFVEKEFNLAKALASTSSGSQQELIRGGMYPCKMLSGKLIDVEKVAKLVESGKWFKKKLNLEWTYNYVYTLPEAGREYRTCLLEVAQVMGWYKEDGWFGKIVHFPAVLTTSFGNVEFLEKDLSDMKQAEEYSELAMFLSHPELFNLEAAMIYKEVDDQKNDQSGGSEESVGTFDDYIVKHIPFKINQIGDFIRAADEEQELKKSVEEIMANLDIIKWGDDENDAVENHKDNGLLDKLLIASEEQKSRSSGHQGISIDPDTYTLSDSATYLSTFLYLQKSKVNFINDAKSLLGEITISSRVTEDGAVIENEVALDRKAQLEDIIRALEQDNDNYGSYSIDKLPTFQVYTTIGEKPASKAQMEEDITSEKANRTAEQKHKDEADAKMQEELDTFQEPYCAAY